MGFFDWVKRKGKKGLDGGKSAINYKEISGTAAEIKKMANVILSPNETIKNSKKETFQNAKERLRVNDSDLKEVYKNYAIIFYISLFASLVCFGGVLYNLFVLKSIINFLSMFVIMLFCLINAFKYSFRAFQIKHQKLCSVKEWWDRASEWLPKINLK